MEKKEVPFRLIFFMIMTSIVFSGLIGLYIKSPNGIIHWLATLGICLGVVWIGICAMAIYGIFDERKKRIYQAQEPERLKKHQSRFYCHICGKPSPKPYEYWDDYGEDGQLYSSFLVTDYNRPTELVQCDRCQKWTCPNADPPHLENGVCKKCLEHPFVQV